MNARLHVSLRLLPALLVLGIAGAWAWRQEEQRSEWTREVAALRPLAQEAAELSRKWASQPPANPDTNELRRLQSDHLELLKIRDQITGLSRHADLSAETLRQRIEESKTRADRAQKEVNRIEERTRAKDLADATMQAFGRAIFHLTEALKRTSGPIPASWNDVRRAYESAGAHTVPGSSFTPQQIEANNQALIRDLDAASQESIKPADFELLPVAATYRHDPAGKPPHLIILRERKPRPLPDGGWMRAYGFLDGSVDVATSPDGDFTEWELAAGKPTGLVPRP